MKTIRPPFIPFISDIKYTRVLFTVSYFKIDMFMPDYPKFINNVSFIVPTSYNVIFRVHFEVVFELNYMLK